MYNDWKRWTDSSSWMEEMVKSQTDFLGKMTETWNSYSGVRPPGPERMANPFESYKDLFAGPTDAWKSWMFMMPSAGGAESLLKDHLLSPEKTMEMFRSVFDGLKREGHGWANLSEKIREYSKTSNMKGFDPDLFGKITKTYEEEFRKILNVPKLGLTRLYQERMAEAVDKYNKFNTQLAEFFLILQKPVDESLKDVKKELEQLAKAGDLPENFNEYYQKWMNLLEDHYLKLFKTSSYNSVLAQTIESMGEFMKTRDEIIQDTMKTMPVPTQKDMDDLYKDLYLLKKRIKEMEKRNSTAEKKEK